MASKPTPPEDTQILLEAFQSFSQAAEHLQSAYTDLKNHALELNLELEETNRKLSISLQEQERLNLHFLGILQAMKTGILVIELDGQIMEMNAAASGILGIAVQRGHYTDLSLPEPLTQYIRNCLEHTISRVPKQEFVWVRGSEEIEIEISFALVRPKVGGIMSILILLQDVTLVNRLKKQSQRDARLAAMGEMAAELAHEIRNPLGSIKLLGSLLADDLAHDESKKPLADQLNHSVQTIDAIVSNMLTFSADIHPKLGSVDLVATLRECLDLIRHELENKAIQVKHRLNDLKPLPIAGDAYLLKQMFMNLALNAIKAMKPGSGVLTLDLVKGEEYAELVLKDNGCGIRKEHLHQIFDPFFSTFEGGTGLGLSVVHKIIEKHKGAIELKSQVGRGTSVYISLPRFNNPEGGAA